MIENRKSLHADYLLEPKACPSVVTVMQADSMRA